MVKPMNSLVKQPHDQRCLNSQQTDPKRKTQLWICRCLIAMKAKQHVGNHHSIKSFWSNQEDSHRPMVTSSRHCQGGCWPRIPSLVSSVLHRRLDRGSGDRRLRCRGNQDGSTPGVSIQLRLRKSGPLLWLYSLAARNADAAGGSAGVRRSRSPEGSVRSSGRRRCTGKSPRR